VLLDYRLQDLELFNKDTTLCKSHIDCAQVVKCEACPMMVLTCHFLMNWTDLMLILIDFDIGVGPMNDIAYLEAYMVA